MRSKKKKTANAVYCEKYRQKIQLKRLQSRSFDNKYRKNVTARQGLYRAKRKQQQQLPISSSTDTVTRNQLRKIEGVQRRRQNTAKFKLEIDQLTNENKKLEKENKKLKAQLASLTISSEQAITSSTTAVTSSKFLFQHLSPNAKSRATARLMVDKQDLPRGSIESIRNNFGVNVCY
jgi:cell division septum initiation protein DivIVA